MGHYKLLICAPLLALLAWAVVADLRSQKIRNWLTLTLVLTGLAKSFTGYDTVKPLWALAGLGVGLAVPFVLFAIRAMGAGDVKLFGGIGAWLGPGPILWIFALAAVVGGVIVVAQSLVRGRLRNVLQNTGVLSLHLLQVRRLGVEHVSAAGQTFRSVEKPLPYALAILIATAMVLVGPVLVGRG